MIDFVQFVVEEQPRLVIIVTIPVKKRDAPCNRPPPPTTTRRCQGERRKDRRRQIAAATIAHHQSLPTPLFAYTAATNATIALKLSPLIPSSR